MEPGPAPGWGHSTEPPGTSVALGMPRLGAPMVPRPVGSPRGPAAAPRAVPPLPLTSLYPKTILPVLCRAAWKVKLPMSSLPCRYTLSHCTTNTVPGGRAEQLTLLPLPTPCAPTNPFIIVSLPSSPTPHPPSPAPRPAPTTPTQTHQAHPQVPNIPHHSIPLPHPSPALFFWVGELCFAQFGVGMSAHRCPGTGRWSCGSSWG